MSLVQEMQPLSEPFLSHWLLALHPRQARGGERKGRRVSGKDKLCAVRVLSFWEGGGIEEWLRKQS